MTRLREFETKDNITESGYFRVLGNERLATLMRKIHSCAIRNGNELEDIIFQHSKHPNKFYNQKNKKFDLAQKHAFVSQFKLKRSTGKQINLDVLLLYPDKTMVVELKDGADFDTKKSEGEYTKLQEAAALVEGADPFGRPCEIKIVFWNCKDIEGASSFKCEEAKDSLVTGRDFASMVNVDYQEVCENRKEDRVDNLVYAVEEMELLLKEVG